MKVTVQYFAQLGVAAGTRREEVELDSPCTAQDLVRRLAAERGGGFADALLDDAGALQPTVLLFVGDAQVVWDEPAHLADGQTVVLATPIAGG